MPAPGMATGNAVRCQNRSLKKTILAERLYGIVGARWLVSAGGGKMRRDGLLVEANEANHE